MKFSRNIWWLLPLSLAVTLPLWLGVVSGFFIAIAGVDGLLPVRGEEQAFAMTGAVFVQHEEGRQTVKIEATRVSSTDGRAFLELERLTAAISGRTGRIFHVTSDAGRYEIASRVLTLARGVTILIPGDYTLTGEELHYLGATESIATDGSIVLEGPGVRVRGDGFSYNLATGGLSIGGSGRVRCDFTLQ